MKLLIHHLTVISPDLEIANAWLLIENGRIVAVAGPEEALPAADLVIDGEGRIAMPGFFDIHSHGAAGDDVCDPDPGAQTPRRRHHLAAHHAHPARRETQGKRRKLRRLHGLATARPPSAACRSL